MTLARILRLATGAALVLGLLTVAGAARAQDRATQTTTSTNSGFGYGARALGMGGAFIALADDASAASWNPAGIGQLVRPELTVVGSLNSAKTSAAPEERLFDYADAAGTRNGLFDRLRFSGWDSTANASGIDFASWVQPFPVGGSTLCAQLSYARIGAAGTAAHLYGLDWTDNYSLYPGKESLYSRQETAIENSGFGGIDTYTLGLATGLGPSVYVGASLSLWRGEIGQTTYRSTNATFYTTDSSDNLVVADALSLWQATAETRKISGVSGSFGILVLPLRWLRLGAVYRTKWSGTDTVNASISYSNVYATGGAYRYSGSTSFDSKVEWPASYGFGVAIQPVSTLTLSADYTATDWRKGRTDAEVTSWTFGSDGSASPVVGEASFPTTTFAAGAQNNQKGTRFGAEYVIRAGKVLVPIRAGTYRITALAPFFGGSHDQDPEVKFKGITAGAGISFDLGGVQSVLFDFAFVSETAESRYVYPPTLVHDSSNAGTPFEYAAYSDTWAKKARNSRIIGSMIYRF